MTENIYRVLNLPSSEVFLFTFSCRILRSALWAICGFYSHFINKDKNVQGASRSHCYCKDSHKLRALERHRVTTSQFWKSQGSLGCKSRCWQGCSFWRLKGESVSLSVPASEAACTSLLVVPSSIFTASQPMTLTSAFMVTSPSCTLMSSSSIF